MNVNTETAAPPAPPAFRWLVIAACLATYALVVVGGIVRATGAGDACPDWPRCHGELIPPLSGHVWIEFSHRLLASVIGLLVASTAFLAVRWQRRSPVVFWGSLLAAALVAGQIILGGVTVLSELHSGVVMAHLALASALLATLIIVALASLDVPPLAATDGRARPGALAFRNLALFAALSAFALMLTGSYVSGSGAGLAFRDWPLFDGKLMPDGGRLAMIHATHRFAAAAVGLVLAYLAYGAWRWQHDKLVLYGAFTALGLYVAQALVGAANIWTLLQPSARGAHLALAMALWAVLVVVATLATRATLDVRQERRVAEPTTREHAPAAIAARGPS